MVEKEELDMIDNFFSEPTTKSWEVRFLLSSEWRTMNIMENVNHPLRLKVPAIFLIFV